MDVGTKIKAARIAKGLTQEQLGEILGVQRSAVAKYENGRVVNIKRSTLKKISDVLDIPPVELINNEELDEKKRTAREGGLSVAKQQLLALAENCSDEDAEKLLQMMKIFLGTK